MVTKEASIIASKCILQSTNLFKLHLKLNFMQEIILATNSDFRRKGFELLGMNFSSHGSRINEKLKYRPRNPHDLVVFLAKRKARAVAKKYVNECVIGFDSVGYFEGELLEKPRSREETFERLKELSGKHHQFYTGTFMINLDTRKKASKVSKTDIYMRELSEREIRRYLDSCDECEEYIKKALGYSAFSGFSSTFVRRIEGSANNLNFGLPTELIPSMLEKVGFEF